MAAPLILLLPYAIEGGIVVFTVAVRYAPTAHTMMLRYGPRMMNAAARVASMVGHRFQAMFCGRSAFFGASGIDKLSKSTQGISVIGHGKTIAMHNPTQKQVIKMARELERALPEIKFVMHTGKDAARIKIENNQNIPMGPLF